MTRLPAENRYVKGIGGKPYLLSTMCAVRGCPLIGTEKHHLWRRSFLAGAYEWVELWDGTQVGNVLLLCQKHHEQITVNSAKIEYDDGVFYWNDLISVRHPLGFQPPVIPRLDTPELDEEGLVSEHQWPTEEEIKEAEEKLWTLQNQQIDGMTLLNNPIGHDCPKCKGTGKVVPKEKIETPTEEKKLRKTYSVMVPHERWEDGAETLDELIEACNEVLEKHGVGYDGEGKNVKFYKITRSLAFFALHGDRILSDG